MKLPNLLFLTLLAAVATGCTRSDSRPAAPPPVGDATPALTAAEPGGATTAAPTRRRATASPSRLATAPPAAIAAAPSPTEDAVGPVPSAGDDVAGVGTSPPAPAPVLAPVATTAARALDAAGPAPVVLGSSAGDLERAYADAAGRVHPDASELGNGDLDGITLAPGLYRWSTGVSIPGEITLAGAEDDVWIFQIARDLVVSSDARVLLSGGARARNVFWQVAGQATLGAAATVEGTILSRSPMTPKPGAVMSGKALAEASPTSLAKTRRTP